MDTKSARYLCAIASKHAIEEAISRDLRDLRVHQGAENPEKEAVDLVSRPESNGMNGFEARIGKEKLVFFASVHAVADKLIEMYGEGHFNV